MNYPKFNESLTHVAYTKHPYPDVEDWCKKNIGVWNEEWYKLGEDPLGLVFDPGYRSTYLFRTEQQVLMFNLRWAG